MPKKANETELNYQARAADNDVWMVNYWNIPGLIAQLEIALVEYEEELEAGESEETASRLVRWVVEDLKKARNAVRSLERAIADALHFVGEDDERQTTKPRRARKRR